MLIEYVHTGESPRREKIRKLLSKLRNEHEVREMDATNWSDEEKWRYYLDKLIPISVMRKKRLRGRIRTHKACGIYFRDLIVVVGKDFFTGSEAIGALERILNVHSPKTHRRRRRRG